MKRLGICVLFCLALLQFLYSPLRADELATVTGYVTDPNGLRVAGAKIQATNVETNVSYYGESNGEGLYRVTGMPTASYRVVVQKTGFKTAVKQGLDLHVQDIVSLNFQLELGSLAESVTVAAEVSLVNTESGVVSTVVNREFVENLPINGRSFQTLISLSPGVVVAPANISDPGQFSVNGQRTSANYFTVDGVSANIGMQSLPSLGQTASGTAVGFGVTGGTNNLVSEDALQEFRIQTSTFAPENGRTPGAQVSIATRSGTNQFHGTAFEFLRNDKLDANDWFADRVGAAKAEERINDFGGVFGGPLVKDRTFFFVSYEGQRMRLPQFASSNVPAADSRQNASAALQPFLNAYPLPNSPEILVACDPATDSTCPASGQKPSGVATFNKSFSNPTSLDAGSVRIDHNLGSRLKIFGRYNYAPSVSKQRAGGGDSLNTLFLSEINTQTATAGATWSITPAIGNEFRFNYSRVVGKFSNQLDTFGGAVVPPDSILFPSPFTSANAHFSYEVIGSPLVQNSTWLVGQGADNLQRQFNVVDNVWLQKGLHGLKFGVDFRRLSPGYGPLSYGLSPEFSGMINADNGTPLATNLTTSLKSSIAFRNLGLFAQDTFRVKPRFALTYGLRWDMDFTPTTIDGPALPSVINFNDLATLDLAPAGAPIYQTRYTGFAPRVGAAYQLRTASGWETVLRGGFGIFYDLMSTEAGDALTNGAYPYGVNETITPGFPYDPSQIQPPAITKTSLANVGGFFVAVDPQLKQPRSYQWNATLEQSLGKQQALSLAYVGQVGRELLQQEFVLFPNPNIFAVQLERNGATSDYHSLQTQFQRRMSHGLQALVSYTFSHSIDDASSGSGGSSSNGFARGVSSNGNRGPSDFDIRHSLTMALAYELPSPGPRKSVVHKALAHWSLDNIFQVRSAPPVDVSDQSFFGVLGSAFSLVNIRPDVVPGQPLYVTQCQTIQPAPAGLTACPGGRGLNPAAFQDPPFDPNTFIPTRQGNLGRNALSGFGASQWDFAIRREFHIHGKESTRLQFRSEFFNILNHPNFASPNNAFDGLTTFGIPPSPQFGQSTQMLGRSLSSPVAGAGGFTSIFQIGGPRSVQFALKLLF